MAIRCYQYDENGEEEILCDTSRDHPNVYHGNGQGCDTVWYHSTAEARKAFKRNSNKWPDGHDAGLCDVCACHYSCLDPKQEGLEWHKCTEWKRQWEHG